MFQTNPCFHKNYSNKPSDFSTESQEKMIIKSINLSFCNSPPPKKASSHLQPLEITAITAPATHATGVEVGIHKKFRAQQSWYTLLSQQDHRSQNP